MKRKGIWIFIILVIIGVGGFFAYRYFTNKQSSATTNVQTATVGLGTVTVTTSGSGTVRSGQSVEVSWQTSGKVGATSVELGQKVRTGDVLAALDTLSLSSSVIQAQSDLVSAQAALEELKKPQPYKIAEAKAALDNAKTVLDNLRHPSETAIQEAQMVVLDAQDALDTAQNYVDRLKYPRASQQQIAAAQAAYVIAQGEVTRLQKMYEKTKGDPTKDPIKAQALSILEAAKTRRDSALANLNWLQGKPTEAEVNEKLTTLALAKAQLADAQETLQKLTNPSAEDVALAEAVIADAQKTLDTLRAGPTASDLTVAETRLTLAQATVAQSTMTAPIDGTITDIQVATGDMVSSGTTAYRIDDLSRLYVDMQVSEMDILQIQKDQQTTLTFDAITDKEYQGKVVKIGMVGSVAQGVVNYTVTVQITDADSSILPGMTAAVSVIVAQRADVLVVPNQALKTTIGQRAVTVLFQGQQISIPVSVGLVGDTTTEVTGNALKEGDEVVISTSTSTSSSSNNRSFDGPMEGGVFMVP